MKILILVLMLISATSAIGSLYDLEENHTFDMIKDTSYNATCRFSEADTFPLGRYKQIISEILEYRDFLDYKGLPYLCARYHFKDLPCIRFYYLNCAFMQGNGPLDGFLFNICDSSLCFFDGDAPRFSHVMAKYLPEIIRQERFYDLLNLYFDTFWGGDEYYILNAPSDFKSLWDKYWPWFGKLDNPELDSLNIIMCSQEKVRKDMEIDSVKQWNLGTKIIANNNEFEVTAWTWQASGNLIKWDFIISNREFRLVNKKKMGKKMGPPVIFHD